MFENLEGQKQVVLVEWKYTESYPGNYLGIAKSGTDRRKIYQHLFENHDCVIDLAKLPNVDALYYEPFYQLMRQQFLASKMEAARELGADIVSLLHIAPGINEDFKNYLTRLNRVGKTAVEVWENLVNTEGRFFSVEARIYSGILQVMR